MRTIFEEFTLDSGRRQLLRDGRAIHLSPKAYELLGVLLEKRPNAIAKADLHETLWPDTFVSEVNLAALVAELRSALGDQGRHGRFIRTVHGFGYAFAWEPVEEDDEQPAPAKPSVATAAAAPPPAPIICWLSWGEREYPLAPGAQTIGRDANAAVRFDALSISRAHARITCGDASALLEDLQSKNGTWVNGKKVAGQVPLTDGDEVRLGSVTLVYRNLAAPRPTATVTTLQPRKD
jgi:DNA-binding winged helix-turn-helix (wHTH) protein